MEGVPAFFQKARFLGTSRAGGQGEGVAASLVWPRLRANEYEGLGFVLCLARAAAGATAAAATC